MPSLATLPIAVVLLLAASAPSPLVAAPSPAPLVAALLPAPLVAAPLPAPSVAAPAPVPPLAAPQPAPLVAAPAPVPPLAAPQPAPLVAAPGPAPPGTTTRTPHAAWHWPLTPAPPVLRRFEPPPTPYARGHRGLDLTAARGDPVLAVRAGRVTYVGSIAGRGTVSVLHAGGIRSTYEPVAAQVRVGQVVAVGQRLGTVAGGGHCDGACLHLGALRGRTYLDPLVLLRGGPVILLPLT